MGREEGYRTARGEASTSSNAGDRLRHIVTGDLSDDERRVLILHYAEGMSVREIAAACFLSEQRVRAAFAGAMQRIASRLETGR